MSDEFLNIKEKVIKVGEKKSPLKNLNIRGLCSECRMSNIDGTIRNGSFVCGRCNEKIEKELNHG